MSYKPEQFAPYMDMADSEFAVVHRTSVHDKKLDTKPMGYFKDAMYRFSRNKGSVVCAFVILIIAIYALLGPIVSPYHGQTYDSFYSYALPKNQLFVEMGIGWWDGCSTMSVNQQSYDYYSAIPGAIVSESEPYERTMDAGRKTTYYDIKVDSYAKVGYANVLLTQQEYEAARAYEQETGITLFYPVIDDSQVKYHPNQGNANGWYLTTSKGVATRDKETGELQDIFLRDKETGELQYTISKMGGAQVQTRVLYKDWYVYKNGHEASFLFGADAYGYDIFSRLALGARLSLVLSVLVASIDLAIGIVVGALEGYYGGWFDLIFERIKDILWEIPTVVFMTLFQIYFARKVGVIVTLFFAFIFFDWIGESSTVRAQFYRYKGQEYVLAARTLGAKDRRIIFRHILPNAAGYIVTSSVLSIPGVIFTEANMTYLDIVNLQSSTVTSVGTMLNNGQSSLSTYPHCVFFPAVFISILLICFNIFGNGLRDAFNPSLRGVEE